MLNDKNLAFDSFRLDNLSHHQFESRDREKLKRSIIVIDTGNKKQINVPISFFFE